jgi:hypothetical protein
VVLAACILLAGCTVLASDPTIRPGLGVGRTQPGADLQVAPPGPRPGAEPTEIARGFLQALAGSGGDFVTAREFLVDDAARSWSPEAGTVVFRGAAQVTDVTVAEATATATAGATATATATATASGESTAEPTAEPTETGPVPPPADDEVVLRIEVPAWAEVGRNGMYRELPAEEVRSVDVVLRQDEGEWRIRHVGEGLGRWLPTADFERLYDPYAVHYVSTGERLLIPDIRYLPTDRVATRLAQLQLGEVPGYLRGAVREDIPADARLAVGAVPVLDGVATVDLRGEGVGASPSARGNLWAQFVATLTQVRGVDRVEITLEGNPLEIPDVEEVRSLTDLGFTATPTGSRVPPLIRQGTLIGQATLRPQLDPAPPEPEPAPPNEQGFPFIEPEWRDLALSYSGSELAGVSGDALSRWREEIRYDVPRFATGLSRPCYDRYESLWAGGVGTLLARERLFAVNAAASPADPLRSQARSVRASWLEERRVIACDVSPQGTRIAVISTAEDGGPARLDIGAVVREPNGLPTGVVGPQTVATQYTTVTDAVWLGETSLAILGQSTVVPPEHLDGTGAAVPGPQPALLTLGGRTTYLPPLVGAERITSTGGERNLVVTGPEDLVYVRVGAEWLPAQDRGSEVMVAAR